MSQPVAPKTVAPKTTAPKKVFIVTHGCQMNEYDSSRMVDLLKDARGMQQVDKAEDADVLLLNTCSIREKAQEKVSHQLGRWRELKKKKTRHADRRRWLCSQSGR